ncbi:response regulator [Silvibacterium sp.]|uniref:response regulator n=1 Tax=Silvibacterium sp. TaxID=1964179 RepID=UPI0039E50D32
MPTSSPLILCIDDEVCGLSIRKIVLERSGFRVLTAPDGPSGLELFHQHPIDLVVLDYAMPGMNGGEVAERMRAAIPEVPILLLSAYLDLPPSVAKSVDSTIMKGNNPEVLIEKLIELLPPVKRRLRKAP